MDFVKRVALQVGTLLMCVLMFGQPAQAAQPGGSASQPGHHLEITEVLVDFAEDAIVITGENFDFGPGPLEVLLGDIDNPAAGVLNKFLGYDMAHTIMKLVMP